MENRKEEIRVNWRTAVLLEDSDAAVWGHVCRIGKGRAVVRMDRNLSSGLRCRLVLALPKNDVAEPNCFVEADCIVSDSVHSMMQFHVTLDWLEMKGNGETLLQERLNAHKRMWVAAW